MQFLHHFFKGSGYTGVKTFGRRPVSYEPKNDNKPVREANMMKKILRIGALVLIGVLVVGTVAVWALPANGQAASHSRQGGGRGPAVVDPLKAAPIEGLTPGDPSESEVEALQMALDDEYKAWATYEQVIADFGAVRPFTQIQKAEENHIAALVTLFDRYGLEVPANEYPGSMPSFDTLAEACAAGTQAEIDNAALYDELFDMVDNPDLIRVFTSLQRASQTKHLPAFESCAP
jgi:rubrerythrin